MGEEEEEGSRVQKSIGYGARAEKEGMKGRRKEEVLGLRIGL